MLPSIAGSSFRKWLFYGGQTFLNFRKKIETSQKSLIFERASVFFENRKPRAFPTQCMLVLAGI